MGVYPMRGRRGEGEGERERERGYLMNGIYGLYRVL